MTSTFSKAMSNYTHTENGALSYEKACCDTYDGRSSLFFKGIRGLNLIKYYKYLEKSSKESLRDTFILVFHIRDCRGGKSERCLGREGLTWLFINFPKNFMKVAKHIPTYGRWDDLLCLFPNVLHLKNIQYVNTNWCCKINDRKFSIIKKCQEDIVSIVGRQLMEDINNMNKGEPVSLCAKWCPTENDSLDKRHKVVNILCKNIRTNPKVYRIRYLSPLRSYINIVEKLICENRWRDIDYNKVPGCAMKRLKVAFMKHTPEEFGKWISDLQNNKAKVNAKNVLPYEFIREIRKTRNCDAVAEEQWKVLEQDLKVQGKLKKSVCICDVSGSMTVSNNTVKPIDVAIALSLLISNTVDGVFKNHVISFHSTPTFHDIKSKSLYDRFREIASIPWGYNTDFQAVFDMILERAKQYKLKQKDMPEKLFVFSDMQFDTAKTGSTNFSVIKDKYSEYGYDLPQLIFWNLNGNINNFPVTISEENTIMLSGFSQSLLKNVLECKEFTTKSIIDDIIHSERYKDIYHLF